MTCINTQFVRFVTDNILTEATLTAATQSTYPVDNVTDTRHSYVVLGNTDPTYPTAPYIAVPDLNIEATWPSLQRANHIGFFWGNLTASATLRLRLYSDDNYVNLIYDSGEVQALKFKTLFQLDWLLDPFVTPLEYSNDLGKNTDWEFTTSLFQSAKMDISNPTNTDGYINIGNIFLGTSFVTEKVNIQSSNFQILELSEISTASDASVVPLRNTNIGYNVGIEWESLELSDRNLITENILFPNSVHKPIMIDFFPELDYTMRQQHFGIFYLVQQPDIGIDINLLSGIGLNFQRA